MIRPHIVILGAGFGGVYLAKSLAPQVKAEQIDVTIINRTNYFLFTPLLHEVATGSLSASSVAEPLREVFAGTGVHVIQGDVISIDPKLKTVTTSVGVTEYDYLVIATGADTNYYGISGAEKFALPLKNLADAARIRARIIDSFERAVLVTDPKERLQFLSFAIVGGGATGVETAAELSDFAHQIMDRYYHNKKAHADTPGSCHADELAITLVHTGPEVLQPFPPVLRKAAAERLTERCVSVQLGSTVTSVTKDGLMLSNNTSVPAHTVIWAAGVKANVPHFEGGDPTLVAGRLAVDQYFNIVGNDRIFAFGDVAAYADATEKHAPLPMLAQVAVQEADAVARNILASIKEKKLRPFTYHSKGSMVSVGSWFAIGYFGSFKLFGKITWWMWRTVYLFKFASWKKRFRIMFEWTLDLLYPRDITKLE